MSFSQNKKYLDVSFSIECEQLQPQRGMSSTRVPFQVYYSKFLTLVFDLLRLESLFSYLKHLLAPQFPTQVLKSNAVKSSVVKSYAVKSSFWMTCSFALNTQPVLVFGVHIYSVTFVFPLIAGNSLSLF